MLLSPTKAKQIICQNERAINDNLLLLVCRPSQAYDHVTRTTLISMLEEIADMRFGDPPKPGTADYYVSLLYREPFDLAPTANITYRMGRLQRLYYPVWLEKEPTLVAEQLRAFHYEFAQGCESATMNRLAIIQLIEQFMAWVK